MNISKLCSATCRCRVLSRWQCSVDVICKFMVLSPTEECVSVHLHFEKGTIIYNGEFLSGRKRTIEDGDTFNASGFCFRYREI